MRFYVFLRKKNHEFTLFWVKIEKNSYGTLERHKSLYTLLGIKWIKVHRSPFMQKFDE